jgi:hypothetical protein
MGLSFACLAWAMRSLPLGTAYTAQARQAKLKPMVMRVMTLGQRRENPSDCFIAKAQTNVTPVPQTLAEPTRGNVLPPAGPKSGTARLMNRMRLPWPGSFSPSPV